METERREHDELLAVNRRTLAANGTAAASRSQDPPDGGFKAITVLIASFLTNGLVFGVINSYSIIYTVLLDRLKNGKVDNAEIKASLVGVLTIGTTFALSPLSGVLTGFLGLRMTAVLGGAIATTGLLLSSFVVDYVDALCFTYGILYGLGASLAYTPSLAILGQYFKKYLSIVNGIVTIGSSAFTVFMPLLMEWMIENYSLEWMFRLLALFAVCISLCGLMFKPVPVVVIEKPTKTDNTIKSWLKAMGCSHIWQCKKYRLWTFSMPIALFGYFVPYVHIKKFIEDLNFEDVNRNLPLQCIAITSAIGRLTFGFLGDRIDRILLQQISFYVIGIFTIILPFVRSFGLIVAIALGMGLFEGGFIALIGPIAFELVGSTYAAQAIGCMLGMAALPLSIGPPVAGALYSLYKDYTVPFIVAGISPIVGATFMFLIRFSSNRVQEPRANGHAISMNQTDVEKTSASSPLTRNGQANQQ
ncbi:monocarboxylate transporter 10-like [Pectinophora gossypiella]|uniref:monocarboxylate transporter 10-like n=1 Tax=Pectinophora gossypiella TaxID=13191 RepID=UPI00214E5B78|nr:monocarboxylate transporter 10-like [Pectinophora gossypiella]